MYINRGINKPQLTVHEKLLHNKKKWATDAYNNLDRYQGRHDEWEKPVSKGYIYKTFLKWQVIEVEKRLVAPRSFGVGREGGGSG